MALKQDTLSMEQLQAKYSIAAAVLKSDPSLVAALNQILLGKVTDPDLQLAILQNSDWYQKNTDDYRKYQVNKTKNPATFEADLQDNAGKITAQYRAMGIQLSPEDARKYAEQMMMKSQVVKGKTVLYNQTWLNKTMADAIDFTKTRKIGNTTVFDLEGKLETVAQSLYKTAWDYGYQNSTSNEGFNKWMQNSVRGLVSGEMTIEQVDDELQKRAISMFPGLANQITQGKTLREAADPWVRALADTWEMDPNDIDLNDDYVFKALNQQNEKGEFQPMNLAEAKTLGRKNKEKWLRTSKAKEEYTGIGQKILQDFGFLG